jgi:hypothetical protein
MCMLWKFSMSSLVKPDLSMKSIRLLQRESSPYCRRNHCQNSRRGPNSSRLRVEIVPVAGDRVHRPWRTATPSCVPYVRQLVFDERWHGDSPLIISVCNLPHQLLVIRGLPYKDEQYRPPWWDDQWHETCMGLEVYVDGTSPRTAQQLLHHCHGLRRELNP